MKARSYEKGSQCRYDMGTTVVRANYVKIHSDIFEGGCNESHDLNKPGGGAGGTMRNAKPFTDTIQGTEAVRRIVPRSIVNCVHPEKRSNYEKTEPPPRTPTTSSTREIVIGLISAILLNFW